MHKARFPIGKPDGPRTGIWNIWKHTSRSKADVFLSPRSLAGALKISFHESGQIRDAFTKEFYVQHAGAVGQDRARLIWPRQEYADQGVVRLYQLCFPHSELRDSGDNGAGREVTWVPPARETNATFVEFLLTRPGIESLQMNNFQPTMDRPIAHWYLPTDENFLVVSRAGHLDDERLVGIAATATSIRPPDGTIPTDAVSLHLTLVMEPVDGVGATIETAWPCTVAPAA